MEQLPVLLQQLDPIQQLTLSHIIPVAPAVGSLGYVDVEELLGYMTPFLSGLESSGITPITTTALPSGTAGSWGWVGPQTSTQSAGPNIVTTAELNLLVHNGTAWILTKAFSLSLMKRGWIQSSETKPIVIDWTAGTFTYVSGTYVTRPETNQALPTTIGEAITLPNVMAYVIFVVSTGKFILKPISDPDAQTTLLGAGNIPCGTVWASQKSVNLNGSYYKIGAYEFGIPLRKTAILQTSKASAPINFSFATNQIILSSGAYVLLPDTATYPFIAAQTLTIPNIACYILYKISTNVLEFKAITDVGVINWLNRNPDYAIIGTCFKTTGAVNMFGAYYQIDGKDYGIEASDGGTFVDTTQRLILPPTMYFVDGEELPVYKNSILSVSEIKMLNQLTTVVKSKLNKSNRYRGFNYNIDIKPEDVASTFQIGMRTSLNPNFNYYKDITKDTIAANTATGKSKTFLHFADSIGAGGIPTKIIAALTARGASLTSVGTYPDLNGTYAEAKGGWSYRQMVGKDNNMSNQPVTRTPDGSGVSSQFSNPFLKLATTQDKTDHPTWCFRNTGVQQELSYQDDPVKTGDFYIFDFGWYITTRGISLPDFVMIGFGINDIGLDGLPQSTWLAQARLGMEIMIKQIKSAYPNIIIGVIPPQGWSSNSAGDDRNIINGSVLVENIMTDIKLYQATLNNIHVVPIWAHFNRDFNFEYPVLAGYQDTVTNISAVNDSKRITRAEFIHFNQTGYEEYIRALEAWVINVI